MSFQTAKPTGSVFLIRAQFEDLGWRPAAGFSGEIRGSSVKSKQRRDCQAAAVISHFCDRGFAFSFILPANCTER